MNDKERKLKSLADRCKRWLVIPKRKGHNGIINVKSNPKSVETIRQMDVQWIKVASGFCGKRRNDIDWSHVVVF